MTLAQSLTPEQFGEQFAPSIWDADNATYHADTNSLQFHGTGVPGAGASIQVSFDPIGLR